jgi:hypothetical protein
VLTLVALSTLANTTWNWPSSLGRGKFALDISRINTVDTDECKMIIDVSAEQIHTKETCPTTKIEKLKKTQCR